MKVVTVKAIEATPATFKDYGQVIEASPDGDGFGPNDAQLDLSKGIPRFSFNLQFFINFERKYLLITLINSSCNQL